MSSVKVFYCYAREDGVLRMTLEKHLYNMRRQGQITDWHDRDINAGKKWQEEININLNTADIILLLISPDFMYSDYCYSVEMTRALARHENGTARVIPIILRPVDWVGAPFCRLQALPTGAVPVTDRKWRSRDEAFLDVTQGIRKAVTELLTERNLCEGNLNLYRRQYEEALDSFEQAIHLDPCNSVAYERKGLVLHKLNRDEEALAAFEKAIYLDPHNALAYNGKGYTLHSCEPWKRQEALDAFEQAIRLNPTDGSAYLGQGNVFMHFSRYDKALAIYEKAIEIDIFSDQEAYKGKAVALYHLGRYKEALATYEEILQKFPDSTYVYKGKADTLYKLERYEEALLLYEKAISLDSKDGFVYKGKADTLYQLNRYKEALDTYEQVILLIPDTPDGYRGKGNVLQLFAQQAYKIADDKEHSFSPLPDWDDQPFY